MPAVDGTQTRALPGRRGNCQRCRREIVWARTVAGPSGPGGKAMPLDPIETTDGNTAVRPVGQGTLYARVLQKDETHDRTTEYLAMPHFATCSGKPTEPPKRLPENVTDLEAHRARRAAR